MRNISDKPCTQTQNTYFIFNDFFYLKTVPLMKNEEKYCGATQAIDGNIYGACASYGGQQGLQTHTQNI